MRILLINPWIADVAAYDFWLKPVGLLILGGYLSRSGHELRLIDCLDRYDPQLAQATGKLPRSKANGTGKFLCREIEKPRAIKWLPRRYKLYGWPEELVARRLRELKERWDPEIVMVTSAMTYWYPAVWKMIRLVKETLPRARVLLGGNYPVLLPDHAALSGADAICIRSDWVGVRVFLEAQGVSTIEGPDSLIPLYDLYPGAMSHLVFLTSVGCPFHCSYCATGLIHRFFQHPFEELAVAIEAACQSHKCQNVAFFDDALLVDHTSHFDLLLKMLIQRGVPTSGISFHLPNGIHARLLTKETARLMRQANVQTIKVGLETLDLALQAQTGSKVTTEEFVRSIEILRSVGFSKTEVSAYLMVNLPSQSIEDVEAAVRLCERLDIGFNLNEYTPIPRTAQYEDLVQSGKLPREVDPVLLNNTILPYWWPHGVSADEIAALKKRVRVG
ncbi:MAG: radical SAM protein [Thermotogaceae bacterium]|nr:radical SAM protein [Thermotogota bacterium]NLH19277.1 radical SAM protein [Thermotogaceae bacterium]